MSLWGDIRKAWGNLVNLEQLTGPDRERLGRYAEGYNYYTGAHRAQLVTRLGQADDNVALNFTGLIVNRAVTMLMGKGVHMTMPDDRTQELVYTAWDASSGDILLHKLAQHGAVYGTCYVKIIPEGATYKGQTTFRLIALDPYLMEIQTDPEDIDTVRRYVMRFVTEMNGKETARREIVEENEAGTGWVILNQYSNHGTGGQWHDLYEPVDWPWPFPPIVHWQNLPMAGALYGKADIGDVIALQDRVNFVASNISKIVRYHAHPKTWGKGIGTKSNQSWGADEMLMFSGDNAAIANLEMQSDLASSREFMLTLRQAMFDVSQTVDMSSMADKVGSLTNFGLRVLFMDALAKLNTKQELYGEAIEEINRRMCLISGYGDDGGEVEWDDPLPVNEAETAAADLFELQNGLVSKETVATRRGNNWQQEVERMGQEQAMGDSVGAAILRAFNNGA